MIDRLDLEHPLVQAGMGGGLSGGALAGAVSAAGALGTVGIMEPPAFAAAIADAQRRAGAGRPVAANLLVPFTKDAHARACEDADVPVVALHGGFAPDLVARLRRSGIDVWHQVGTAAEARRALADGATGLVAQGAEAGGHLVGVDDVHTTLRAVLEVADGRVPVLAAGGVADGRDAAALIAEGAAAAVAGTRFLLTDESGAHPAHKQACVDGSETVDTMLFALGWPMRHRVLVNEAMRRWMRVPRAVDALNRRSGSLGSLLPLGALRVFARVQHPAVPLFSPGPALAGMPERTISSTALYAGESVARIDRIVPAAEAVAELAGAPRQALR